MIPSADSAIAPAMIRPATSPAPNGASAARHASAAIVALPAVPSKPSSSR